ncbi:undecaprenyl-diphosphate phosphatase [Microaerobacter geothermalis]|uniref:undecaprenyl-diphosphate phosphatase n=1 Tax=Microaerobacter geothermalis TaxID=674972 RepID=UPI001F38C023|nr:undecaprenyl-diphosphate phosphatase [Microaerobacter geothermalis]MCF6092391.1 undecaprenyl-diphosphate phosphatase [Microaerobacter geothermalis]
MNEWLFAIFIGVLQGLTEWWPISSSAHLVLFEKMFNFEQADLTFELMLHFGSLLAVLIFFWKDISSIVIQFFRYIMKRNKQDQIGFLFGLYIIISTFITFVGYVVFDDLLNQIKNSLLVIALAFFATGIFLWIIQRYATGRKTIERLTFWDSIGMGIAQTIALIPGISRSGSTLVAALWLGMEKPLAIRYSFIMAIPIIAGGAILTTVDLLQSGVKGSLTEGPYLLAILSSFFSAILGIKWLMGILERVKLHYFSYYTWMLSLIIIIYLILNG